VSHNIVLTVEWRKLRWGRHVARRGNWRMYTEFWWGNIIGNVFGRMILEDKINMVFRTWVWNWEVDERGRGMWSDILWVSTESPSEYDHLFSYRYLLTLGSIYPTGYYIGKLRVFYQTAVASRFPSARLTYEISTLSKQRDACVCEPKGNVSGSFCKYCR